MKNLCRLLILSTCWTVGTVAAQVCSCPPNSPDEGFDRAQYVFTGKVVSAQNHVWFVAVERVWKGQEKLRRTIKLMDVYARMDCEFFSSLGSAISFLRFWQRAVEKSFITRKPVTGHDACNRRESRLLGMSLYGSRS